MPNLFQKLKNNLTNSNRNSTTTTVTVTATTSNSQQSNEVKKNDPQKSSFKQQQSTTSSINQSKNNEVVHSNQTNTTNQTNKNNINLLSLIIDSSILNEDSQQEAAAASANVDPKLNKSQKKPPIEQSFNIFDPDDVPDETETFNHTTFLDDKSFIVDDDDDDELESDKEVSNLNNQKINEFLKGNSCYTINELPETSSNKSNRAGSSRASSRSSLGSESVKTNSSDRISSGLADSSGNSRYKRSNSNKVVSDSYEESEGSGSTNSEHAIKNGSKNALLDALIRKYNVNSGELENDSNSEKLNDKETKSKDSSSSIISKQTTRYIGEDQKRKQSELEKKINKLNAEKQFQSSLNNIKVASDSSNLKEASSSFDDDPKSIKVVRNTGTQMSTVMSSSSSSSSVKPVNKHRTKSIAIHRLPQNFECKYIGKTKCKGLWGLKNIREPVDHLINNAKKYRSLNELPDVEALISEKGINIIQKPPNPNLPNTSVKILKNGLLPISNISYAVQDNVYGKVFSCIVVREKEQKVVSECYSFLCSKNEKARKMALSITLAFKEYAKLIQTKESKINKTIKLLSGSTVAEPDSFA